MHAACSRKGIEPQLREKLGQPGASGPTKSLRFYRKWRQRIAVRTPPNDSRLVDPAYPCSSARGSVAATSSRTESCGNAAYQW
jgi:hypothetical protein